MSLLVGALTPIASNGVHDLLALLILALVALLGGIFRAAGADIWAMIKRQMRR